jgi:hypothetical protein
MLHDHQWQYHIRQHPELVGHTTAVEATITGAGRIQRDATHSDRRCYYRRGVLPAPYDRDYLKVVVRFGSPDARGIVRGEVVTACATPTLMRGEDREW